MLERGGNAVDASVAAAAVMAVTSPHMCGLGGDLFAVVARPGTRPEALNASGRAGSGADPERLRAEGMSGMPFQHDVRAVTVPGCVDGLVALHGRHGALELTEILRPARRLAENGFPVSPTLAEASGELDPGARRVAYGTEEPLRRGRRLRVPGLASALEAVGEVGAIRVLRGRGRTRTRRAWRRRVHRGRPRPAERGLGRAPEPRRVRASAVDGATQLTGLSRAVRRFHRRRGRHPG